MPIPAQVQASKAITRGDRYTGAVAVTSLERLQAAGAEDGEVQADLRVERTGREIWLRGSLRGAIALTCQRGLHAFIWPCDLTLDLRLVESEAEEARLLKQCDPYLVQEDRLPLRELIEDEVLLALPIVPRCPDENCAVRLEAAKP